MGEGVQGLSKFFVSNLPDRCSSMELGELFRPFGDVVGVYVARKRDKNGNSVTPPKIHLRGITAWEHD
ncbi:putative RNA recognition motif domain, nucleotide-binding alpha-beta plait domain superfamily [Helianthus anomalus]